MARCQALPRSPQPACFVREVVGKTWVSASSATRRRLVRCLGRVGSADPAGVRYLCIFSNPLTSVPSVESCTARVTKRALERVTTTSEMSSASPRRTRLATCDKASSNLACEKAIQKDRGEEWTNALLSCDTHTAAGCHGKTASLVAEDNHRDAQRCLGVWDDGRH